MKSLLIITMTLLLTPASVLAQNPPVDSTQHLDEVIIQESYQANFEEEKPPLHLAPDLSPVVKIAERVDWRSLDAEDAGEESASKTMIPLKLSNPELVNIAPAPVKIFRVQFKNLARWQLDITASDGTMFRSIAGEGTPPENLPWDGIGTDGEPLVPGRNYAYSFTAVDRAGNKKVFPGETFTAAALYLQHGDSLWVGLAGNLVFSSAGGRLAPGARALAKEIASLIRYYAKQGRVTVASRYPLTEDFLQMIGACLSVETSFFQRCAVVSKKIDAIALWIE